MTDARRDAKRRGEQAELAFALKAWSLGFNIAKPFGDSARYDWIVDAAGKLSRVQVKCAEVLWQGAYYFNSHRSCNGQAFPYSKDEIDLLVGYVPPYDAWYIIPVEAFGPIKSIRVYPHRKPARDKYERFRDAWHLLRH